MSHVTCYQFLIVRSFFFFVLLVIVALTEFHPIAVIVFLFACAYFLVSPLSSPFLPVTFVLVVALSLKVLSQADHDMLRVAFAGAFTALYVLWQFARIDFPARHRFYFLVVGISLAVFFSQLFAIEPADFGAVHGFTTALVVFLLFMEFVNSWRLLYPQFDLTLRRRTLFSFMFAFLFTQMLWALSLLPIGFLNLSAIAGLLFFISCNCLWHFLDHSLSRHILFRSLTLFVTAFGAILWFSKWSI
ncbi:MAG: hypothetical protein A2939_04040 [Parcubacteria group bacterium RIFCSPLOWO2_01_FULL_48_18]|nr:MAG: hypothetical protein A3J67_05240 [Parcubacteria group bacterium RIFCSPHIGHO2_02_FULL_48_10b]OHB22750.1 MAG: hypothetical protein A2939_04040 [Parcubacteria group bacterium RIFCSPLOWO2_01_FULL_48_18]